MTAGSRLKTTPMGVEMGKSQAGWRGWGLRCISTGIPCDRTDLWDRGVRRAVGVDSYGQQRPDCRRWREGTARVPRLLGPERGSGLPVHALGHPGPAPPGLGPQRAGVRAARRPLRRRLRPHPAQPAQPRQCQALQAAGRRRGARRAQRLVQWPDPLRARARTRCRGQTIGSDSPPTANGVFNNNQTYTGCAVDSHGNVFGNDIATAQGDYPPPSSGRLVEWFAPNYTDVLHRLRPRPPGGWGRTTPTARAAWPSRG